jgi:hypothetical protein
MIKADSDIQNIAVLRLKVRKATDATFSLKSRFYV